VNEALARTGTYGNGRRQLSLLGDTRYITVSLERLLVQAVGAVAARSDASLPFTRNR
jgi:hypothetical protein